MTPVHYSQRTDASAGAPIFPYGRVFRSMDLSRIGYLLSDCLLSCASHFSAFALAGIVFPYSSTYRIHFRTAPADRGAYLSSRAPASQKTKEFLCVETDFRKKMLTILSFLPYLSSHLLKRIDCSSRGTHDLRLFTDVEL